jgi:osmotically inducible protein OsmC
LGSGAFEGQYSFDSRFANGTGTNPEELIAAAHAGCYSMALAGGLGDAGYKPERVATTADVHINKVEGGFAIQQIDLRTEVDVDGIEEPDFQRIAEATKEGCPVSKVLTGAKITLSAKLSS